jgi:hypothetical protein
MPRFDAATIAETLDYSFAPDVKAEGTIPEPSDQQIGDFLDAIMEVQREAEGLVPEGFDQNDAASVLDAMNHLKPADFVRIMSRMSKVYATLCSNHPTENQIQGLPLRKRRLFFDWIQNAVISPEAVTGDGTEPGTTRLSAVAG